MGGGQFFSPSKYGTGAQLCVMCKPFRPIDLQ